MSDTGEEESRIWPPPPSVPSEEAGPPPKPPRVTDQAVGRVSLGLSGLGSLCALVYDLVSVVAPHAPLDPLLMLQLGSAGCFVLAFFSGFVGWYSWEGKVSLCLALLSPFWILIWLALDVAYGH